MVRLVRFGWYLLLLIPLVFLTGCVAPYGYGYGGYGGYPGYGSPYGYGGATPYGYSGGYGCPTGMTVPVPVPEYPTTSGGYYPYPYPYPNYGYQLPLSYPKHPPRPLVNNSPSGGNVPVGTNPPVLTPPASGGNVPVVTKPPDMAKPPGTNPGNITVPPGSIEPGANTRYWNPRASVPGTGGMVRPALPSGNAPRITAPQAGSLAMRMPPAMARVPAPGRSNVAPARRAAPSLGRAF
jgi:hypothetical protein